MAVSEYTPYSQARVNPSGGGLLGVLVCVPSTLLCLLCAYWASGTTMHTSTAFFRQLSPSLCTLYTNSRPNQAN